MVHTDTKKKREKGERKREEELCADEDGFSCGQSPDGGEREMDRVEKRERERESMRMRNVLRGRGLPVRPLPWLTKKERSLRTLLRSPS
jgi:hypothetical protein